MRSFLFASLLATGGFFGFKNVIEPRLHPERTGIHDETIKTNPHLESARKALASGDDATAETKFRLALKANNSGPVVDEFATFLKERKREREALTILYESTKDDVVLQKIRTRLDTLNAKLFNANDVYGGTRYVIRGGDTLAKIAKAHGTTDRLLQRINKISNPNKIHAGQAIKVINLSLRCEVNITKREMRAYNNNELFKVYRIGVGSQENPTPTGSFKVSVMQEQPPYWSEPGKPPIPAGDPRNPLGSRWLGFAGDYSSYGIHGTNRSDSIGKASSKGCLRLAKADVEELFDIANYGMVVKISE